MIKRLFILILFAGLATVLPACSSSQIPSSISWGRIPVLPTAAEEAPTVAGGEGATGIKATDDGKYLYLEIMGYKPPVHRPASGEAASGDAQDDLIAEDWVVTLDSDALVHPRTIVFSAGKHKTECSDPAVKFEEQDGRLRLAVPKTAVAASPVHIRVERIIRLLSNGRLLSFKKFSYPPNGPAVYDTAGLPIDQRVPRVEDVHVKEAECTAAVLQWETNKRLNSKIRLAADGEPFKPVEAKQLNTPRFQHKVRLNELEPDTFYRFSVSGKDLSGNLAAPVSGSFRTAVPDDASGGLQAARDVWRAVPVQAPPETADDSDGDYTAGVSITRKPTTWSIGRELSPGKYRLLVYNWHTPEAPPIHVYLTRSTEVPLQKRHLAVLTSSGDGKLHQHEVIFSADTPFDEILLKTGNGHAGPITSFKLYEVPAPFAGRAYFGG